MLNYWNHLLNSCLDLNTKMPKKKSNMLLLLIVAVLAVAAILLANTPELPSEIY